MSAGPWSIPNVQDALERGGDKFLTISVTDGRVVLRTPPGDTARLTGEQVTRAMNILGEARLELFRQEQGQP